MAGTVNKVILIGHLGQDPEVKTMQSGDKVANFSVATSESWKDKASGERKERTNWANIVVFNQGLIRVCDEFLKKGSKVYIEGQLETRSYDKDGEKRYVTEVVLRPFKGEITMLDKFEGAANGADRDDQYEAGRGAGHDGGRSQQDTYRQRNPRLER